MACPASLPQPTEPIHSQSELKYLLLTHFDKVFFCDPDHYPVAREGQEEKNALEQFPVIKADHSEFTSILSHLAFPDKPEYTTHEKVLIYRERKKLTSAVQMNTSADGYRFTLRIGEGQGSRIEGVITSGGRISVLTSEPSINTCPICLSKGTLIDTPLRPVPVEEFSIGMTVWSLDDYGRRVAVQVIAVSLSPTPTQFWLCRLTLSDGRAITASPGHPTGDGRHLGDLIIGNVLDGSSVMSVDSVYYDYGATYDLLPEGASGLYWANGILLRSTLCAGPVEIYR
jgi:hypothetical protein